MAKSSSGLFSPAFVAAAIVLIVAIIGLEPAVTALQQRFQKQSIELRRSFDEFDPEGIPGFRPDFEAPPYETTDEDVGTAEWFSMAFRRRDAPDQPSIATLLTYYSDPRDTVPHTPEVCFRQIGATIERVDTWTVPTPGLGPNHPEVQARLLLMSYRGEWKALLYVFVSNGEYYNDRESLRWALDPEEAIERCADLLAEMLPVLLREHFPLDEDLR
jgi:hypothetical protein